MGHITDPVTGTFSPNFNFSKPHPVVIGRPLTFSRAALRSLDERRVLRQVPGAAAWPGALGGNPRQDVVVVIDGVSRLP